MGFITDRENQQKRAGETHISTRLIDPEKLKADKILGVPYRCESREAHIVLGAARDALSLLDDAEVSLGDPNPDRLICAATALSKAVTVLLVAYKSVKNIGLKTTEPDLILSNDGSQL